MKQLKATPYMMRLAQADIPLRSCGIEHFVRSMYLRCISQFGILKVSIFLPVNMRMGATMSAFDIYISKEKKQFLTYDRQHNKWLTAMICNLPFSGDVYWGKEKWISRDCNRIIQKYLNTKLDGYKGIEAFQKKIREEDLIRRHKRETDLWDKDLKQTPGLPKDWSTWVYKTGIPEHYIIYRYVY